MKSLSQVLSALALATTLSQPVKAADELAPPSTIQGTQENTQENTRTVLYSEWVKENPENAKSLSEKKIPPMLVSDLRFKKAPETPDIVPAGVEPQKFTDEKAQEKADKKKSGYPSRASRASVQPFQSTRRGTGVEVQGVMPIGEDGAIGARIAASKRIQNATITAAKNLTANSTLALTMSGAREDASVSLGGEDDAKLRAAQARVSYTTVGGEEDFWKSMGVSAAMGKTFDQKLSTETRTRTATEQIETTDAYEVYENIYARDITTHYRGSHWTQLGATAKKDIGERGELDIHGGVDMSSQTGTTAIGGVGYTHYGEDSRMRASVDVPAPHTILSRIELEKPLSAEWSVTLGASHLDSRENDTRLLVGLKWTEGGNAATYKRPNGRDSIGATEVVESELRNPQNTLENLGSRGHVKTIEGNEKQISHILKSQTYKNLPRPTLSGSVSGDAVTLTVSAVPGATTYEFYEGSALVGTSTSSTLVLSGVTNGVHVYSVVAKNGPRASERSTTLTVTVNNVINQAPTANLDAVTTPANTLISFNPLTNDTDPENNALSLVSATSSDGTITISGNVINFTPNSNFIGEANIIYIGTDDQGNQYAGNAKVTVSPIAPTTSFAQSNISSTVGSTFIQALSTNSPAAVTYTSSNPAVATVDPSTGLVTLVSIGTATITASQPASGIYSATNSAFSVTATAVPNQSPDAFASSAPISVTSGTAGSQVLTGTTDPDGDTLTYTASNLPAGFSFDANTRTLSWSTGTTAGSYSITLQANDGKGGSTQQNISINVTAPVDNVAPVITLVGPSTLTLTVGDTYTEQGATWTDNVDGSGTVTNISGTVDTSTPGTYTRTYTYIDAAGNLNFITRTIIVNAPANQPPDAFTSIAPIGITAGTAGSQVLPSTTDSNGDSLTYSLTSVSGVTFNPTTRTVSWDTSLAAGTYTATYRADDGNGGSTTTTVTFEVTAPVDNLAPSQTNSTNLGSFTLGNTLSQTLTFDEAISTATVSGLPAGVSATTSISGSSVTVTLSVDPLVYSFTSATDTIPFTLTVGDGAPTSNTRAISESAQIADVAPIAGGAFAALSDMTISDNLGMPIVPDIDSSGVTDTFGRTIIYSATGLPAGLSINSSTGFISGAYDAGSLESYTITIIASTIGGTQSASKTFVLSIRDDG